MTGEMWDNDPLPMRSRTCSLVGFSLPSATNALAASTILSLISGLIFMGILPALYQMYVCIVHTIHTIRNNLSPSKTLLVEFLAVASFRTREIVDLIESGDEHGLQVFECGSVCGDL